MQRIDVVSCLQAAVGGVALGVFFFGGLWWTVRAIANSAGPALLQFASLVFRMGGTLVGFYLLGGGDLQRLVACLAGFVLARAGVARWVRASTPRPARGDAA